MTRLDGAGSKDDTSDIDMSLTCKSLEDINVQEEKADGEGRPNGSSDIEKTMEMDSEIEIYDVLTVKKRYWYVRRMLLLSGSINFSIRLKTGPKISFIVGPQGREVSVSSGLISHFSDYAKACLKDIYLEGCTHTVRLEDVDPTVFRWLRRWLVIGDPGIRRHFDSRVPPLLLNDQLKLACKLLCRLHFLGERLLFDGRLLEDFIQVQLDDIIEEAKYKGIPMPLDSEIVEEVLSESAPVHYGGEPKGKNYSLRPFVLKHLCTVDICTSVDWADYADCFQLDGAFAAEMMIFLDSEIAWAEEARDNRWFNIAKMKDRWMIGGCILEECDIMGFREESGCFEEDGAMAAERLGIMAEYLRGVLEAWRKECNKIYRGGKSDGPVRVINLLL